MFVQIPSPSRRGRGKPRQVAYRIALNNALGIFSHALKLTQTRRDRIVAILTSVVFDRDTDPDTIRRHRERRRRPDNSDL